MIIKETDNQNLRDTIMVSPWFRTRERRIILRLEQRYQVAAGPNGSGETIWQDTPADGRPALDHEIGPEVYIDPATMAIVDRLAPGAVNAVGFMGLATGRQIGLSDLDNGSIYEAMATKIEAFITVNGLV